jgi:hypothetical protein
MDGSWVMTTDGGKHWTDGLWGRQIREQEQSKRKWTASSGSWGNWVRVKRPQGGDEGKAVCFVEVTDGEKFIVVLWDGNPTPELVPAAELLHHGYWHTHKGWYLFKERL